MRKAVSADIGPISESMRRAFWDDPIMGFLLPDDISGRAARLRGLMGVECGHAVAHGEVYVTDAVDAAAIWAPPGKWKIGGATMLRLAPRMLGIFRAGIPRALSALSVIEKKHPSEPHWYLAVLGTVPEAQGKGKGTAVMQPVLERCDREGMPAYLESSKEHNVPFYERHGFRVTERVELPKGGPPLWLMWRDPQPA